MPTQTIESPADPRFSFGKNWTGFLADVRPAQIEFATECLAAKTGDLTGKTFLDVGSGSGIHSLSALRLGAKQVHSFDYDADSVAATAEARRRFGSEYEWTVGRGSALDTGYLDGLGTFDVVYSWGVLHHTGDMWAALGNLVNRVAPGGLLFVSIYNDQGRLSRIWKRIKRRYVTSGPLLRRAIELLVWCVCWGPHFALQALRLHPGQALRDYADYGRVRGMSAWHDVVDWAGGYPFEVASPEAIFEFYRARGFVLERLKTCGGGIGCNEFVFRRPKNGDAS